MEQTCILSRMQIDKILTKKYFYLEYYSILILIRSNSNNISLPVLSNTIL